MNSLTDEKDDEKYMHEALLLGADAAKNGEVPVGAVVVLDGKIIGRGANLRETTKDPTTHAEIIAIREAARCMGDWRLEKTSLYVTLEPCPMCAGAIINARIPRVVYGCDDPKAGALRTMYRMLEDTRLNHRAEVVAGVSREAAALLLTDFFSKLRKRNTAEPL